MGAELNGIQVPGRWSNLAIMLLIFSSRYYFGYDLAVNPQHQELLDYQIIRFASSEGLTGILLITPRKKLQALFALHRVIHPIY